MPSKQEERAVRAFADKYEKQMKDIINGSSVVGENPNVTFREFAVKWLEKTKRDCSLGYYVKGCDVIELVNEYIGGYKLRELSPAIIQSFYDKLDKLQKTISRVFPKPEFRAVLESHGFNYMKLRYDYHVQNCSLSNALNGKAVGKTWSMVLSEKTGIPFTKLFNEKIITEPYAYESIHMIKRTVRAILAMAKKSRLIEDNYASADYINFPKRPAHRIEFMDDEQAKIFYKTVMDYPDIRYKTAMLLFLLTGFRRGEVTGLQWNDIDFDGKTITVNRSITTVKGHGSVLKKPKTEKSERTITVADTLITALSEYRNWWLKRRELLGDYMEDNEYLFTQENGKALHPSTFIGWLKKILNEAGLDPHSLHSLRHTNITMQIAAGVPLVTVAARAGHARASTTTDIYAHFIRSSDKTAAEVIDKVFSSDSPAPKKKVLPIVADTPPNIFDDTTEPVSDRFPDEEYGERESAEYFKWAKAEMQRLGFETVEEFEEYQEYMEHKKQKRAQRKNDYCM
jgi:integrase